MADQTPRIKGIFVNSHVRALRDEKGTSAVRELEKRYGSSVAFKNLDDIPVREEVKILELVLDLMSDSPVPEEKRSFEAGRLHFRNFIMTPFGRLLASALPKTLDGFRKLIVNADGIARHVFTNSNFTSRSEGERIVITMDNSDYPIDHFRGLFYEWMLVWNVPNPAVEAREVAPRQFEYTLHWTP